MSKIWNYVSKEKDKYICLVCNKTIASFKSSTSNLWSHVRHRHRHLLEEESTSTPSENSLITSYFEEETVEKKLVNFVATTYSSLRIVEAESFQSFARGCPKDYKFPSRKKLTAMIASTAENIKNDIRNMLSEAKSLSLTTDIWTSPNMKLSFLAVTAVSVSDTFIKKSFIVDIIEMELNKRHTSEYIQELLENSIRSMSVDTSKVFSIVADAGANVKKAIQMTGINYICCTAHQLNCFIQSALEPLSSLIQRIQKIVQQLHTSHVVSGKWIAACERHDVPSREICGIVPTRWNTIYMSICDVLNSIDAVQDLLLEIGCDAFTQSDVHFLQIMRNTLSVFFTLTEEFCHQDATVTAFLPGLLIAKQEIIKMVGTVGITADERFFLENMLIMFQDRFNKVIADKHLCLHVFMDPRFAFSSVFTDQKWLEIQQNLHATFQENEIIETPCEPEQHTQRFIWDQFRVPFSNGSLSLWEELAEYKRSVLSLKKVTQNPLEFWKFKTYELPQLSLIARQILVTPATSVDCERLFSSAGIIYGNKRRQRLTATNTRNLLLIATKNKKDINYSRAWSSRYSPMAYDIVEEVEDENDEDEQLDSDIQIDSDDELLVV